MLRGGIFFDGDVMGSFVNVGRDNWLDMSNGGLEDFGLFWFAPTVNNTICWMFLANLSVLLFEKEKMMKICKFYGLCATNRFVVIAMNGMLVVLLGPTK